MSICTSVQGVHCDAAGVRLQMARCIKDSIGLCSSVLLSTLQAAGFHQHTEID